DALVSGASGRDTVEVQVLSWAPWFIYRCTRFTPGCYELELARAFHRGRVVLVPALAGSSARNSGRADVIALLGCFGALRSGLLRPDARAAHPDDWAACPRS